MFGKSKAKLTDLKIILIKEKSGVIKLFNVGGNQVFLKKKKISLSATKKFFCFVLMPTANYSSNRKT